MIKTFEQFINEADEIKLNLEKPELQNTVKVQRDSNAELEIVINAVDKDKNLRELLKFLRHSTSALTITCIEDESKNKTEFKWNGHKNDSILFLNVTDLDDNEIEDDENETNDDNQVEELENDESEIKDLDFQKTENSFE